MLTYSLDTLTGTERKCFMKGNCVRKLGYWDIGPLKLGYWDMDPFK